MVRALLLFLIFFQWGVVQAYARVSFGVRFIREGPDRKLYLVIQVDAHPTEKFPVIIRLNSDGNVDPSFGRSGVVSLKNWESWPRVSVANVDISPSGHLSVLGELSSRLEVAEDPLGLDPWSLSRGPESILESLFADSDQHWRLHKEIEARGEEISKLYISKFDRNGHPIHSWGDEGTVIVHHVLESGGDSPRALKVLSDGTTLFTAESVDLAPDRDRSDLILGKLSSQGKLEENFGNGGIARLPHRVIPTPKGMKRTSFSSHSIHSDEKGIHVIGLRSRYGEQGDSSWNPGRRGRCAVQWLTLQSDGLSGVRSHKRIADLSTHEELDSFSSKLRLSDDGKILYLIINRGDRSGTSIRSYTSDGEKLSGPVISRDGVWPPVDFQTDELGNLVLFMPRENGSVTNVVRNRYDLSPIGKASVVDVFEPESMAHRIECADRLVELIHS